jgi:hypothetical protein
VVGGKPPHEYALVLGATVRGVTVRNNIFMNQSGPVILARSVIQPSVALLQGNDYFSADWPASVQWGPTTTYPSLSAWQAGTGQETAFGQPVGMTVNPDLGSVFSLPGGPAARLRLGDRFVPGHGSPVLGRGLKLERLFGVNPGTINFAGTRTSLRFPTLGAQ